MTEPQPRNDFASFPAPAEGILVALFITVRKVARSRDFYSRVLGGTIILDENPCTGQAVQLVDHHEPRRAAHSRQAGHLRG